MTAEPLSETDLDILRTAAAATATGTEEERNAVGVMNRVFATIDADRELIKRLTEALAAKPADDNEPFNAMAVPAITLHEQMLAYMQAGFSHAEAFELIRSLLSGVRIQAAS